MSKSIERKIIIFLLLILIGLGVSACADKLPSEEITTNPPKAETQEVEVIKETDEPEQQPGTVQNIPNIVDALTCMFSTQCEDTKQERQQDR